MNIDCRNALAARHRNYPTYNWSTVLPYAINSLLAQPMPDFELIRRRPAPMIQNSGRGHGPGIWATAGLAVDAKAVAQGDLLEGKGRGDRVSEQVQVNQVTLH
jgi:hypothetical protein